jgi:hypothetical protein
MTSGRSFGKTLGNNCEYTLFVIAILGEASCENAFCCNVLEKDLPEV